MRSTIKRRQVRFLCASEVKKKAMNGGEDYYSNFLGVCMIVDVLLF